MTLNEFIDHQLAEADRISKIVSTLQEIQIPQRNIPGVKVFSMVSKHYDETAVEGVQSEVRIWQDTVRDFLRSNTNKDDDRLGKFERTIIQDYNRGIDFKSEFNKELREGSDVLKAIKQSILLSEVTLEVQEEKKNKLIFISHAGSDKNAADKLVNFLKIVGLPSDKIFCSSTLGNDIKVHDNFVSKLHDLFAYNELFVIFLHSNEFYKRPICMNEMGAAWAKNFKSFSIILHGNDLDILNGVIRKDEIVIRVDEHDHAYQHLNDLLDAINEFLGTTIEPKRKEWDSQRTSFLRDMQQLSTIKEECSLNEPTRNQQIETNGYGKPVPMAPNRNPNIL